MKIKQIVDIVTRMFATFIATALGVVGSGALVGVDVAKAALMAGVGACAVVLERLSRSYLEDGVLSKDEINAAFGNDVVDDAIAEAIAPDDHRS
jgi:CBS-domain-containing membrane protein